MLNFLLGDRIAKACRDSWHLDGWEGRLNALIVVASVGLSVGGGIVTFIQSII